MGGGEGGGREAAFHSPLSPAHPTREQVAVQLFYGNGRGPDRVSARRGCGGWGGMGALRACVRVWVVRGGVVVVDVDVTPTPSNAPDPEQMAGQGLSAEPELIACAMSYCLRPPTPTPPRTPTHPHSYFTPPCYPDFCTPTLPLHPP